MSVHDFATVRAYEDAGILEVAFQRGDDATYKIMKKFRGTWLPAKYRWAVDPSRTQTDIQTVVEAIRDALVAAAPAPWVKALPELRKAAVTTNRFSLVMREGGVRLRLAPGHKHEYLLKAMKTADRSTSREGQEWIINAVFCADEKVKLILGDILKDDRAALSKMIDYMAGYSLHGALTLVEDEVSEIGLAKDAIVFADPSFVRKADQSVPKESLIEYPFKVLAFKQGEEAYDAQLAFLTGPEAWNALRQRYTLPIEERRRPLDVRHVANNWIRKRT